MIMFESHNGKNSGYPLYNRSNNILEIFLKNKANLHNIEDYLRQKLFYKNEYLSHIETIFLARILYGRIINSNEINQKLDARHSKAQIITVTCLAFYLNKNKDIMSKNIEIELYNLLQYHIILIEQHLNTYSLNVSFKNDDNYYNYCKDLNFICKIISLHNNLDINNNEIIKQQDKIIIYINPSNIDYIKVKNTNLRKYISNLKISDFYVKYQNYFNFDINDHLKYNLHNQNEIISVN